MRAFVLSMVIGVLLGSIIPGHGEIAGDKTAADEEPAAVKMRIEKGDPTVVPLLIRWLAEASDVGTVGEGNAKLFVALQGVGEYRLTNCAALAVFFYKKAPMHSSLRQAAADALATMGGWERLAELKGIMWDQQQALAVRCKAAAALGEMGDDSGREFLLLQYDLYRLERKTRSGWYMDPVRTTLEQIDDPLLAGMIVKRMAQETDGTMRNNITTLVARMKINAEPLDKLRAMAANTSWAEGKYRRYAAIEALGRKAGPDCIPFLESLPPWDNTDYKPDTIQQRYIKEFAGKAISAIRRRYWQTAGNE